ncbi:MAG: IS1182 family transposase [Eubacterium sp.]|nr:IS1182 family transposase [Eubacterium sp.]
MQTLINLQKNYTLSEYNYQFKLPFEMEVLIPDDDPVRLLNAFVEELELSDLYQSYGKIKSSQVTPRQMFKIVIYAAMNRIYSCRDIETACKRDINFMYLLEGKPAPDHATIARFLSLHFSQCSKKTLAEVTEMLYNLGEISGIHIFIDGTKIESAANRYTFVWKKAVTKHQKRLCQKIAVFVEECEILYGLRFIFNGKKFGLRTLKKIRKKLYQIKEEEGIVFVHGIGKRKTQIQKSIETLEEYLEKLKEYTKKIHRCGDRNSYSKTDPDATFMRMKEDHMRNGQLKPAYNLQHGVDSEYITWLDVTQRPTDTRTLIPFLKDMEENLTFHYRDIVADAGYESEENYLFLEENGQNAYIKPNNYEQSKKRKYKNDIGRMENMTYEEDTDRYICFHGKELPWKYDRKEKTATGYQRITSVYECADCKGCPYKTKCIKGNHSKTPMEDRVKRLYVSKTMKEKRSEDLERITSEYGTRLRMNRSVQAEGSFADVKADMAFRRYSYRGMENVTAQSVILAIAHNINKFHHKIQNDRTGRHLFELKKTA